MAVDTTAIEDVEILLENSYVDETADFLVTGRESTFGSSKNDISESPDLIKLIHDQAVAISKIFYQKNKETQGEIVKTLIGNIGIRDEITRTVVYTLFQIGAFDQLLAHAKQYFDDIFNKGFFETIMVIGYLVYGFWDDFSRDQIKDIRLWSGGSKQGDTALAISLNRNNEKAADLNWAFANLYAQTNKVLVKDVKKRIELGYNPEINEDEIKIKEEFTKFGFPADLSQALDKVDQKFNASKDAFDFKGTMDLLRSFTERLYRSILDEYGEEGKKVKEQDSEVVAKFFTKKGLVNNHFGNMIASQRHFISDLASHRLKSREEDARLSKNMVIEMSLYLMRRLRNN